MKTVAIKKYPLSSIMPCRKDDVLYYRLFAHQSPIYQGQFFANRFEELFDYKIRLFRSSILRKRAVEINPPNSYVVALLIERVDDLQHQKIVVQLDSKMVISLLDEILSLEGKRAFSENLPLDEFEKGVLSYLVSRVLSKTSWRLQTILVTSDALNQFLGNSLMMLWSSEIERHSVRGKILVWISDQLLKESEIPKRKLYDKIKELSLSCVYELASELMTLSDIESLQVKDVLFFDGMNVNLDGLGRMQLRVSGSQRVIWEGENTKEGFLIKNKKFRKENVMGESRMEESGYVEQEFQPDLDDHEETEEMITQLGDARLEISVELTRFTMTIEALSKLAPGEIVQTGQVIGDEVVLRNQDKILAKGRLVDVEGEIGIQLLEILGEK